MVSVKLFYSSFELIFPELCLLLSNDAFELAHVLNQVCNKRNSEECSDNCEVGEDNYELSEWEPCLLVDSGVVIDFHCVLPPDGEGSARCSGLACRDDGVVNLLHSREEHVLHTEELVQEQNHLNNIRYQVADEVNLSIDGWNGF